MLRLLLQLRYIRRGTNTLELISFSSLIMYEFGNIWQHRRPDFSTSTTNSFQDVLFDANVHRVKKFIMHTNFPGHYNFNM